MLDAALSGGAEGIEVRASHHAGMGTERDRLDDVAPATDPAVTDDLDPIPHRVGDRLEIICDGGVRRGSDIVKAVALGARACMVGRAYLYALGAAGERGVEHVLRSLDTDVRRTMALIGVSSIQELNRELVA